MARFGPGATLVALACTLFAHTAHANNPPLAPVITEPAQPGQIVNPEDVHMETGPFSDPDPGDQHACSDWEIWTVAPAERVWSALCVRGLERLHIHLGDGEFEGSHAGRTSLLPATDYTLRVRHKDDSGEPGTEWSPFSPRPFTTGAASQVYAFELEEVADSPAPSIAAAGGGAVTLPGGATPATIRLEGPDRALLLEIRGTGGANQFINPPPLAEHVPLRVSVNAGSASLLLPDADVEIYDHDGVAHAVYLPALSLAPAGQALFWISANGSSYVAEPGQTEPVFSKLARGAAVPWKALQPGYKIEVIATGFQLPVNVAFVPNPGQAPDDPVFYVSELYGTIKVMRRDGAVGIYAEGLLNFNPTGAFPGSGEQGLTGLCVEPASGDLFATLLYDAVPPNGPHYPKVVRFKSNDGGLTASSQTIILNMVGETQGQSHQISNVSIGPDGKLYVHMGDGFDSATAQNLNSYRGKVLRMNLDGSAPNDNPFYNAGNGINSADYVYAYGFRNPFGGAWRAADGQHYEVENGPSIDRFARVTKGTNYGWSGTNQSMMINALYNWAPSVAPVNIAFVQPQTFGGSEFPAAKQGHAFVSESGPTWGTGPQQNGKRITEFTLDPNGNVLSGPTPLITYTGGGKASCVALAAGPDGLYFSDLYKDEGYQTPIDPGANVLRVRFVGTADFTANVTSGPAPLAVQFTDASNVPSAQGYLWDFGDGASSTQQNPAHVYDEEGLYDVRLSVTTPGGLVVAQKNAFIAAGDVKRVALIAGSLPLSASDHAVEDHLAARGFQVTAFDDAPANRPPATQLALDFDLVVLSSTIASSNIGGEFRNVDLPLFFWEQALLRVEREPLASDGGIIGGALSVNVINNSHPITAGLPNGMLPVFSPGANMSVGRGTIAPQALVLAHATGAPADAALLVADKGALLLGGHLAPARRVFMIFEDSSWLSATPQARDLFDRAVCWAMGVSSPTINNQPVSITVYEGHPAVFAVKAQGAGAPATYQWRRDAAPLSNGGNVSGATHATLHVDPAQAGDAGVYDVVVGGPCGQALSTTATLSVNCLGDTNGDKKVDQQDLGLILAAYDTCEGDPGFASLANLVLSPAGPQCVDQADLGALLAVFGTTCP